MMGSTNQPQQPQTTSLVTSKVQQNSLVKEALLDSSNTGPSVGFGISSRRLTQKEVSNAIQTQSSLSNPASSSAFAARIANKLPSGGVQQQTNAGVSPGDYYSNGSRNVTTQQQNSVGNHKRGQGGGSNSNSVVRKHTGGTSAFTHQSSSRNNIANSMIKTSNLVHQGRIPNQQQKLGVSGRMQKQFHQYMGQNGGSPPFKGIRTSMNGTLGVGNTMGALIRQEGALTTIISPTIDDQQTASIMTLIPIKVSATTLRETPKNGSPPTIQYSNKERSADRQIKQSHYIRANSSHERSRHRGQSQSTLNQTKNSVLANNAAATARNTSIGLVPATLCYNHQQDIRPKVDIVKPQSHASIPFTYYQGSMGDEPILNTSTGDLLNTSHNNNNHKNNNYTLSAATSPKTQRSPRLTSNQQQQKVMGGGGIPQMQPFKSPIQVQKMRQIPSNGSPTSRVIVGHQKTMGSSRLSAGAQGSLTQSAIKKSISLNAQQIALQQRNKKVGTLQTQQLIQPNCLQIDLAQLSAKNIMMRETGAKPLIGSYQDDQIDVTHDAYPEQTPFVVYGATGSEQVQMDTINALSQIVTPLFNEYNHKSPMSKRDRSNGKAQIQSLLAGMKFIGQSPSIVQTGETPIGNAQNQSIPNFFPRSPKTSLKTQNINPQNSSSTSGYHRHSVLNSTTHKQRTVLRPQQQSKPKSTTAGSHSENVSAQKLQQTKTQRFKTSNKGAAANGNGAAKNLQFSKYPIEIAPSVTIDHLKTESIVQDYNRLSQIEVDEKRLSVLIDKGMPIHDKITISDMEQSVTFQDDQNTPDRNQVIEVDGSAILQPAKTQREIQSPDTMLIEEAIQISITPLRTTVEPNNKIEISTSSNYQSIIRKPESVSGVTSPKSVIKGTPKVVIVPVEDDEECLFPISKSRFLSNHPEIDEEERKEVPETVFFYPTEVRPRTPVQKFNEQNEPLSKYDDQEGYYLVRDGDHLCYRFEIIKTLGKGSFAQVVSAKDHKMGKTVAIKITRNTELDHKFAESEAKLLRYLMKQDPNDEFNIVRLLDEFKFRDHHCFVFEILEAGDLFENLKNTGFAGFSVEQIKIYAKEILKSLVFLEYHKIIHCDLKPENILLLQVEGRRNRLKLVDFGSGSFRGEQAYTYVQSRFYRAPEVILRLLPPPHAYTEKVDIWSLGCILAELYTGEPLFPGNNEQEQLELIMEICGIPPSSFIDRCRKKDHYFDIDYSPLLIEDEEQGILRIPDSRKLEDVLSTDDADFIDFIRKCLTLDPEDRFSASEAVKHPWITGQQVTKFDNQKVQETAREQPILGLQSEDSSQNEPEIINLQYRSSTKMSHSQYAFIAATTSMRRREEEVKGAQLEESPDKDPTFEKQKKSLAQHFTIQTFKTDENPPSFQNNIEVDSSTSTPLNEGCIQGGSIAQKTEETKSIGGNPSSSLLDSASLNNPYIMNDMEVRFVNTNNLQVPLTISSFNSPNKKSLNTSTEKRRDRETRKAAAEAAAAAGIMSPLSKSSLIVAQSPLPQAYDSQGQSVKVLGQYEIFRDDLRHSLTKSSQFMSSNRRSVDQIEISNIPAGIGQIRESINSMTSGIASEANIPPVHADHQGIMSEESMVHQKSIKIAPITPQINSKKHHQQSSLLQKVQKPAFNAHTHTKQPQRQHTASEAGYSSNHHHGGAGPQQSINSENSINKITITFYQKRTHQIPSLNATNTPKQNVRK